MIKFLKQYSFLITLALVLLALSFWFEPTQQKFYLETDFELLKNKSHTLVFWTVIIGALIVLVLAIRKAGNLREIANVLIGVGGLAISFYFTFQTLFLSAFLFLNKIPVRDRVDKKFTTTFFVESDEQTPVIYDFRLKRGIYFSNIEGMEKLQNSNVGDTVVISFTRGLLGFDFDPKIK